MKKVNTRLVLTAIAAAIPLVAAAAQGSVPASAAENGRRWFVEFAGAPLAEGGSASTVQSQRAAFRRAALAAGVRFAERRSFGTLFNGISIDVDPAHRARLATLPGVKAVYPVVSIAAPKPETASASAPDLVTAIEMTGAKIAQERYGLSGQGVKVAIIDTGVDIDHPAFGGSGTNGTTSFPTARIVSGYDFVGDNYNAGGSGDQLVPVPDAVPDDCNGHGTHVAGIVGANGGGIVGVAPQVSLGAYRVFGCTGSTDADVMVAAMERAYADGMQVINMSIGAARQWPQYPTAQAADRMVKNGVVVVASIGNNGPGGSSPDGLFAAGAPGVGEKVIGVASFDNAQVAFSVNGTPYGYNPATGAPMPPTSGSLPMAKTGTPTTPDDACNPLPAGSMAGKAVLIRRGTCSFHIKSLNAQNAGAAAVVLYNNAAGALNPTVAGTPPITIPVVGITADQGATLDAQIAAGPTTLTWTSSAVSFPYGTGGLISGFSSFGLTPDLQLKPNIGAPGGGILSAYPLEAGGQAVLSGTSMASPHVAGAVALILEKEPAIRAGNMMERLQNVADPKNWSGNPSLGFIDYAFRQGAGMLDVVGVLGNPIQVTPSQLSVGESEGGPVTKTLVVTNKGTAPVTYNISHVPALAAGPNTQTGASYAPSGTYDGPATVTFSASSVTVPAKRAATFTVTVEANATLPDRSLYGGYVVLTPAKEGQKLSVPYAGFKGDYQSTQVLTPTANGFPWLAKLVGTSYQNQPSGATYTLAEGDIPYFLIHLDHQSRRVMLEAFDADTGTSFHRVSVDDYVTRSATPTGFFAFTWDGTTFRGKPGGPMTTPKAVPNGRYTVKVSVLKALGNPDNPAHWETWTSPVVTIARP